MKRIWILSWCLWAPVVFGQATSPRPPNIVWILADDLGWTDAAYAGSRFYETPHLDALAASGLRFSSFYVSPGDLASRAAYLTGQYPARLGLFVRDSESTTNEPQRRLVPPVSSTNLPPDIPTIAGVLKAAGYRTGVIGQGSLGGADGVDPAQRGFMESVLTRGGQLAFKTEPAMDVPEGTYLADFITDRALEFIERNREGPFFLYLTHRAVRAPHEGKPEFVRVFAKKAPAGGHRDAVYAAMIASLDESVGRVLGKLEELKLSDTTVVIFTSDNGGAGGYAEGEAAGRRQGVTDNSPLRGGNGMVYEGGLRVPFLVRWPGVTQPGSRSTQPTMHVDLFPTLCDIAGARPPADLPLDGVSLAALFRDPAGHLGRDAIYWHFPEYVRGGSSSTWRTTPVGAVRAGNFKLLEFFEDGRLELYNVVEDLSEKDNLVRSLPEKAGELRAKLGAWRQELNVLMPSTNGVAARARP